MIVFSFLSFCLKSLALLGKRIAKALVGSTCPRLAKHSHSLIKHLASVISQRASVDLKALKPSHLVGGKIRTEQGKDEAAFLTVKAHNSLKRTPRKSGKEIVSGKLNVT